MILNKDGFEQMGKKVEKKRQADEMESKPFLETKKRFISLLEDAKGKVLGGTFTDISEAAGNVKKRMVEDLVMFESAAKWPQDDLESAIGLMVAQARGEDVREEQVQDAINRAWDAQDKISDESEDE